MEIRKRQGSGIEDRHSVILAHPRPAIRRQPGRKFRELLCNGVRNLVLGVGQEGAKYLFDP
jgi:hypothetical protein